MARSKELQKVLSDLTGLIYQATELPRIKGVVPMVNKLRRQVLMCSQQYRMDFRTAMLMYKDSMADYLRLKAIVADIEQDKADSDAASRPDRSWLHAGEVDTDMRYALIPEEIQEAKDAAFNHLDEHPKSYVYTGLRGVLAMDKVVAGYVGRIGYAGIRDVKPQLHQPSITEKDGKEIGVRVALVGEDLIITEEQQPWEYDHYALMYVDAIVTTLVGWVAAEKVIDNGRQECYPGTTRLLPEPSYVWPVAGLLVDYPVTQEETPVEDINLLDML